ncbi:hypothetical protein TKK_0006380 [Trichogramma kaykai]|uniref:RRM domain-containing protein n=1 Tax=Trichogramma kaykai TaxID=54128 RepID=A0ABD2XDQ9_9HYME
MVVNDDLWYQDEKNNYWVLFPNKFALDEEEIRKIFSNFGTVRGINKAGDEKGLRFVRYKTQEEAVNAVHGLENHPTIHLKPNKNKHKEKSNEGSTTNTNNEERSNFFQRKSDRAQRNVFGTENDDQSTCSGYTVSSKIHCMENQSVKNNFSNLSSKSFDSNEKISSFKKTNLKVANNSHHVSQSVTNIEDINDVPDLVVHKKTGLIPQKKFFPAGEIIVGNIPMGYGSAYMLDLFNRWEPLAVTGTSLAGNSDIRFCRVYFKSEADTKEIEKCYDNYVLSNKKLVVLRPSRLMEISRN